MPDIFLFQSNHFCSTVEPLQWRSILERFLLNTIGKCAIGYVSFMHILSHNKLVIKTPLTIAPCRPLVSVELLLFDSVLW